MGRVKRALTLAMLARRLLTLQPMKNLLIFSHRNIRGLATAAAVLILVAACGGGKQTSYPEYDEYSDPTGRHVFKNVSVACDNGSDCSPSVGMLVFRMDSPHSVGRCTGFLTDDGYLRTNDHCLPKRLTPGTSCLADIDVYFPATSTYSADSARCDRVIWRSNDASNENAVSIDTAFLKLTTTVERPALHVSHNGFQDREKVRVYSINPVLENLNGTLVSRECLVVHRTLDFPTLTDNTSQDFVLTSASALETCEIISGNSGSPVLGQDGEAHGIVHNSNRASDIGRLDYNLVQILSHIQGKPPEAIATNFGCVQGPSESSYVLPANCAISASQELFAQEKMRRRMQQSSSVDANGQLDQLASKWGKEFFPMFDWRIAITRDPHSKQSIYIPVPYCTRSTGFTDPRYSGANLNTRDVLRLKNVPWPAYVKQSSDPLMSGLESRTSILPLPNGRQYNFSFRPSDIKEQARGLVQIEVSDIPEAVVLNETLEPCH